MALPRIAILGAGSIGCFVGGCWQSAGLDVTMIGRERLARDIATHGLELSDQDGWHRHLDSAEVTFATDPKALGEAELIALCVKSGATAEAAKQVRDHATAGATVLSLQNGVSNVDILRDSLGERNPVVRGMVFFNVAYLGDGHFHKGVAGQIWAEDTPQMRELKDAVGDSPAGLKLSGDMLAVAWGKLLINLNNAVNALSGRTLVEQLKRRDYRRVVAASMREGLALLSTAGIEPAKVSTLSPRLLPTVMGAPDWLFNRLFLRMQKIDAHARSSMADDLTNQRRTEIDYLNGELIGLAERLGRDSPVNRAITKLVRDAEQGGRRNWPAAELRRAVLHG